MKVYEVRIHTKRLTDGLVIIMARDADHAKQKAMAHHSATGVVSVTEVRNE